jgi:sarcosine oxidase/L-pipecolate oxidase
MLTWLGCIFPPDGNNIVKIASIHKVTNYGNSRKPGVSLPRFREDYPSDEVPEAIQKRLRDWVREMIPEMAKKPWSEMRLCW